MIRRRGSMLLGVMLVVVLATLIAATATHRASANADLARVSLREGESRSLLRSGVRVYLSEFASSRDDLLRSGIVFEGALRSGPGVSPLALSDALVVSEVGGRRGIVRLLPWPSGVLAQPESAKLDLNRITREILLSLPEMTEAVADAILLRRGQRPFESVEELLLVDGVDLFHLYGDLTDWADRYGPLNERESPVVATGLVGRTPWADLLTVFAAEPNVQSGLGGAGDDGVGEPRLFLGGDSLEGADLVGLIGATELLPDELERLRGVASETQLYDRLIRQIAVERWGVILDAATASPDPYLVGRVDLCNAPLEVLSALPGVDESAAAELIRTRAMMSGQDLLDVTWPVRLDVLTPEQFRLALPWLATRTMQYRVLIEAGFESWSDGPRSGDLSSTELDQRVVAEMVIDVSGEVPRVAYLRDVTWLAESLKLHASIVDEREDVLEGLEFEFADPFAPLQFDEQGPAAARADRHRDRAQQQREATRRGRPGGREGAGRPRDIDSPPPVGLDRRIGRWNGMPRGAGS